MRMRSSCLSLCLTLLATLISAVAVAAPSPELKKLLAGPLTQDTIKDVIHEHRSEIRRCAEARPKDRQSQSGRVVVHFLIGLDGSLSDVRVGNSSLSEPSLESCLVKVVQGWRFPKPKKGAVEVNFPFRVGPPGKSVPPRAGLPAEDKPPANIED